MKKLPDKKWELLQLAMEDLEKCEADPRYEINMGRWHSYDHNTCCVCLAGSVMARSLSVSCLKSLGPEYFDLDTSVKLRWLDDVRAGYWREKVSNFLGFNYVGENEHMPQYPDPEWKIHMASIIGILKAEDI